MTEHISPITLDGYRRGSIGVEGAVRVKAHIAECQQCTEVLTEMMRSTPSLPQPNLEASASIDAVKPGELVVGKYRIEHLIGIGGMGTVVAAWHLQLNQRVALKFMLPALARDLQAVDRFQREARAAARLQAKHVCRVFDLDALPNGLPFLVMELLEGETLEQRLIRSEKIPPVDVLRWLLEALTALEEAHALEIVHRDLKPANLFLVKNQLGGDSVKVVDFGIAKSKDPGIEAGLTSTSSRVLVGSPPYMSPEQVNPGMAIDGRSDIWSLGVVAYELLTGQLPFQGETYVETLYAVQKNKHKSLTEFGVVQSVSQFIDKCLEKAPEHRFQTARQAAEALMTIDPREPILLENIVALPAAEVKKIQRNTRRVAAALMALVVVLVAAASFGAYRMASPIVAPGIQPQVRAAAEDIKPLVGKAVEPVLPTNAARLPLAGTGEIEPDDKKAEGVEPEKTKSVNVKKNTKRRATVPDDILGERR